MIEENLFVRNTRISTVTTLGVLHCFCSGAPVAWAARYSKLAARTVRGFYLAFRSHLTGPEFNPWHALHTIDPRSTEARPQSLIFRQLAKSCYFNETCRRNFTLGNRKTRLCRACLLTRIYEERGAGADAAIELLRAMDAARDFYSAMGIREKAAHLEDELMYLQMLHHQIIGTANRNSTIMNDGLIDHLERKPLSGGRLMNLLESRLLAFPIEDRIE